MYQIALVFFGAGIGGVLRFLFGKAALQMLGAGFPFGTLGVNIIGSFIIGISAIFLTKLTQLQHIIQYFVMIGVLGGFTTFSSFSLDVIRMIEHSRFTEAFAYILASVAISILAVFVGMVFARQIV